MSDVSSAERERAKRRRWRTALPIVLICLPIALILYGTASRFLPRSMSKDDVVQFTGLTLPASAKLVNSRLEPFMEIMHAKIEMDQSDVDAFVKSLPEGSEASRKELMCRLPASGRPSWWAPGTPQRYVSFVAKPRNRFVSFGLISLDGQRAVLYLYKTR